MRAQAAIDRFTSNSYDLIMEGESYRARLKPGRTIAGCSMGALVGGIYAMGKLEEYEKWTRQIDRRQIF